MNRAQRRWFGALLGVSVCVLWAMPVSAIQWDVSSDDENVRECFEVHMFFIPGTERLIVAHVTTSDVGEVSDVTLTGEQLDGTQLASCLTDAFLSIRFDADPYQGQTFDVPLLFRVWRDEPQQDSESDEDPDGPDPDVVSSTSPTEVSPLDPLDAELRFHVRDIRVCYEEILPTHPSLGARLVLGFTVETDGTTTDVEMVEMDANSEAPSETDRAALEHLTVCITSAASEWTFDCELGESTPIQKTFILEPAI